MDYAGYLETITAEAAALRAAAVEAGPTADVPTCAEWDVFRLVRHTARVHAWARAAVRAADPSAPPERTDPPTEWDALLPWWDEQCAGLVADLGARRPDDPAWVFPTLSPNLAFWARRQAHETTMHRMDAESALATPSATPIDPRYAADGIDEMLTVIAPLDQRWAAEELAGTVLYHAADAGRAWLLTCTPGQLPEVAEPAASPGGGLTADATVAGTADAVYRAVWGRPSTAITSGPAALTGVIHGR